MKFVDLKAQEEKIDDIRFVIASAAKRSIHMVLDCRSHIRFFAMTSVYPLKCVLNLMNK
jgi:hypothetical protein